MTSSVTATIKLLEAAPQGLNIWVEYQGLPADCNTVGLLCEGEFLEATPQSPAPKEPSRTQVATISLPIKKPRTITPAILVTKDAAPQIVASFKFGEAMRIPVRVSCQRVFDRYRITVLDQKSLRIDATSSKNHFRSLGYNFRLLVLATLGRVPFPALLVRSTVPLLKGIHRKPIWIISDRESSAGDNGEALLRHICENPLPDIDIRFSLRKQSPDYQRIKQYGFPVIDPSSWQGRLTYLLSDWVISSQANSSTLNPFGKSRTALIDLAKYKFAFLQHGVTKDDISQWIGKQQKNIDLIIASAQAEADSFISTEYGYAQQNIALTGMPRFDYYNKSSREKSILLAPTWRTAAVSEVSAATGKRAYAAEFRQTALFDFYQHLITNPMLNEALEKYGYKITLKLHPNMEGNQNDFHTTAHIRIASQEERYQELISEQAAVITDYSSLAFDFAYLGKPVVYAQFDADTFFTTHTYQRGYFSYETNGFGPITQDLATTVQATIQLLENNCQMETQYLDRANAFFQYRDNQNSARAIQAILNQNSQN